MLKRLEQFVKPFITSLGRHEPKENAHIYISGLLSDMKRKSVESIAYCYDQHRRALQRFIGFAQCDHQPLQQEVARQVGNELGEDDGAIVFGLSGYKKCGNDSVGVQRQWLGQLGKVDNGQVGVYIGYASCKEYVLTVPQVRIMLYVLLRQACNRRCPGWAIRFVKRKSKRRELARFHHYKQHNLLAPLRVKERK